MKRNKIVLYGLWLLLLHSKSFANLIYHPVSFVLSTDKESYYEGEKITFYITITNNDKERTHPVLLQHTQNTGEKLFYLTAYDKAKNTLLLRYTENKQMNMMVHDTGTVQIKYLKPQEQIVVPIYLNDFENYYSYHTQNASHHSFGVPLFAGIYHINVTYNPKGLALGDSLYTYYDYFDKYSAPANKQLMPREGQITPLVEVRIKRRTDTIVSIERKKYFDLYAEYISRFEDGDIREYRKFSDWCPSYLFTERYNEFKQKTHYELQLPDKRFYSISYHQPGGRIHQESYCSEDGTLCMVTTYIYNKKGDFVRKKMEQTKPCSVVIIDGKKRSATRVYNLEAR